MNSELHSLRFLTVIPARYASTRFRGKPLALLGGKPMVQWVYERAKLACEHVVVATDDARIAELVDAFGGVAVMTSADHPSGTDRCLEAAVLYAASTEIDFDVVINVQGDEPFIDMQQVELLKSCFSNAAVDIATLVSPFGPNIKAILDPNNVKVTFATNGKALNFSRSVIPYRRDVPQENWAKDFSYFHHLGMYAYRFDVLVEITKLALSSLEKAESLEQLRWLENGYNIFVKTTTKRSVGIDTPEDLLVAEKMLTE